MDEFGIGQSFSHAMHGFIVTPREVLQALHEELQLLPDSVETQAAHGARHEGVFEIALQLANQAGRETMEASDLFSAILEESSGGVASIIRRYGLEPTLVVRRVTARIQDGELPEEELRKRFELPPHLKQFATRRVGRTTLVRLASCGTSHHVRPSGASPADAFAFRERLLDYESPRRQAADLTSRQRRSHYVPQGRHHVGFGRWPLADCCGRERPDCAGNAARRRAR